MDRGEIELTDCIQRMVWDEEMGAEKKGMRRMNKRQSAY
jgi:hypothetical protein